MTEPAQGKGRQRDSWGGRAVVLLATSVVLGTLAGKVLDGSIRYRDKSGQIYWVTSGNKGGVIAILLMACAAVCAIVGAYKNFRGSRRLGLFAGLMIALIVWWLLATHIRGERNTLQLLAPDLAVFAVMIGVVMSPPTWRTVASLARLLNFTVVTCLAYSFLYPSLGQLPCRQDKCGIFGSYFTGFLAQENAAGKLVVSLVPAAVAIKSTRRMVASLGLAGIFVAATASRTALAAFVVGAAFVIYLRRKDLSESIHVPVAWRSIPIVAIAVSLYLFLTVGDQALTGRGAIYSGIRDQLHGDALIFGSGADTMLRVAEIGGTAGVVVGGEHGQAPHLLARAGVLGLVLFALAAASLVAYRQWTPTRAVALGFVLVASAQAFTEPGWLLDSRDFDIVTMLFAIGVFVAHDSSPPLPKPGGPSQVDEVRLHLVRAGDA